MTVDDLSGDISHILHHFDLHIRIGPHHRPQFKVTERKPLPIFLFRPVQIMVTP